MCDSEDDFVIVIVCLLWKLKGGMFLGGCFLVVFCLNTSGVFVFCIGQFPHVIAHVMQVDNMDDGMVLFFHDKSSKHERC